MKLGGLFSGIGGFELAWTRLGGEVAWMCEVDPKARQVLEARFPGVPIYPDVQELDPAEVEPVDVLTGGSPCQGFSVAGQREGLLHGESRLFADYVRIVNGLAERGLQWALWENVPGVLSIKNPDGERTFPHVIGALAGGSAAVRLDPRRKWNVGLVADGERAVAWRVLDSRYFGVAQRRRRVFACVAFGDSAADRAGRALLAVAEGVRGDSAAGVEEGEGAAGGVADRPGVPSVTGTLSAGAHPGSYNGQDAWNDLLFPDQPQAFNWQSGGDARGLNLTDQPTALSMTQTPAALIPQDGISYDGMNQKVEYGVHRSLRIGRDSSDFVVQPEPYGFSAGNSADARSIGEEQGVTPPIRASASGTNQSPTVGPVAYRKSRRPQSATDDKTWVDDGQANTLNTFDMGDTRTTHPIVQRDEWAADETGTLQSRSYKGLNHENARDGRAVVQTYGVRRLTPVECERLQAFPDGWTEPAGSDSARYKALGNAVTVNTVGWILRRMKALM